ncbi:MAG: biotin carboxylase [Rhodothermales bacterium]|jgi:biotin carboxylase
MSTDRSSTPTGECLPDRKTLLLVSAGVEAVPGILRAKAMGLHVVVSDLNPDAPGVAHCDDFLLASTYDAAATLEAADRYHRTVRPIDGVLCVAADVPLTVSHVAAHLGLPGIPIVAAELASDKLAMKDVLAAAGIPVPWYEPCQSPAHLRALLREHPEPLVIKPVDSRGSRGVQRITPQHNPEQAFRDAVQASPTGRAMVESFLAGPQVSTESVILGGRGFTPGIIDRNYDRLAQFAPFMIEDGGSQPSILPAEPLSELVRTAEQAGLALGVSDGICKGDMVLTEDGPFVIEVALRLSGGWMSTDQIPLGTGVDLIGVAIRMALGEPVDPAECRPRFQKGVCIRYFFPDPGLVTAVEVPPELASAPWVHKLIVWTRPGDTIPHVRNHTMRAGFAITTGNSRDEAVARAEEVVRSVRIRIA